MIALWCVPKIKSKPYTIFRCKNNIDSIKQFIKVQYYRYLYNILTAAVGKRIHQDLFRVVLEIYTKYYVKSEVRGPEHVFKIILKIKLIIPFGYRSFSLFSAHGKNTFLANFYII